MHSLVASVAFLYLHRLTDWPYTNWLMAMQYSSSGLWQGMSSSRSSLFAHDSKSFGQSVSLRHLWPEVFIAGKHEAARSDGAHEDEDLLSGLRKRVHVQGFSSHDS